MPLDTYRPGITVTLSGWALIAGTFFYSSASAFLFAGDLTNILAVGDKIRLTNDGVKYFYLTSFSYDGQNTTMNVTAGDVYSLTAGAVSAVSISKMETPQGFPEWFTWTPTFAGFSANPAGGLYRFKVSGRACTIAIRQPNTGTSNAGNFSISPPITARVIPNMAWECSAQVRNSGAVQTTSGRFIISNVDVTIITVSLNYAGAGFTASGGKAANGTLVYEI